MERYSGTRPFRDLYMVVAVGQFKLCISSIERVSNLLLVTILAAPFCNFLQMFLQMCYGAVVSSFEFAARAVKRTQTERNR